MLPDANPYGNRRPITNPSQFSKCTNDLSFLAEKIRCGHTCAISAEPLMGKTSLLHYLAHPQGARTFPDFARSLGDTHAYLFLLVELGRLPTPSAPGVSRYLYDLLREELAKTGVRESAHHDIQTYHENDDYAIQRAFEYCLRETNKQVVLLFDDFDIIIRKFTRDDAEKTMQRLRAAIQAFDLDNRLNCIFFSEEPFEQLLKSADFTIDSPLSRIISDYTSLQPLSDAEISDYIQTPLPEGVSFPEPEIKLIKQLAGKHPGLLKIVCYHLFEMRFRKKQPVE